MINSRKEKNIIIIVLLVAVGCMSIAFSAYSQKLAINGMAVVNSSSNHWNISFEDISTLSTTGYATGTKNLDSTKKSITFSCELLSNDDACELSASIVNNGTIKALFKEFSYTVLKDGVLVYSGKSSYNSTSLKVELSMPSGWVENSTVLSPNDSGNFKIKTSLLNISEFDKTTKYVINIDFDFEQS